MFVRLLNNIISVLLFLHISAGAATCNDEIVLIANKTVSEDCLDKRAVSHIYMAEQTKWNNGDTIMVVMQKTGTVHEDFLSRIIDISPTALRNIWKKVIFTGMGNPPRIFKSEEDLVNFVRDTKGAIGYIGSSTSHEGVKIIKIKSDPSDS